MQQTNIFDYGIEYQHPVQQFAYEKLFPHWYKVRWFEAFSGIGTFSLASKYMGANYETIGYSEIDKNAINAYKKIHGSDIKNYGDIEFIEELPECDICSWSFPCQDISLAGKQRGMVDGTRSNYGYVFLDVVARTRIKPKVLIMENVAALVSEKFEKDYNEIHRRLSAMGYRSQMKVLNAKDYGVPQNRERVFIVSILGKGEYEWPLKMPLEKRLKDLLEDNVDEKYYLSEVQIGQISKWNAQQNPIESAREQSDETLQTITAKSNTSMNSSMVLIKEPYIIDDNFKNRDLRVYKKIAPTITTSFQPSVVEPICLNSKVNGKQPSVQDRIYDIDGIATAITTSFQPSIAIPEATVKGYALASDGDGVYINRPHQKRGCVQKGMIQTLKTSANDLGVVLKEGDVLNDSKNITENILSILWERITSSEIWEQSIRGRNGISKKEILQSIVYEERVSCGFNETTVLPKHTHNSEKKDEIIQFGKEMRNLWINSECRCSPQRYELSEQFIREFDLYMSKLSYENSSSEEEMYYLWVACERLELLQQALSSIQEIWESKNRKHTNIRIRKLTAMESFRFMGIKDEDFYKAQSVCSNSQLYKLAGNAIVVDVIIGILKGLIEVQNGSE